MKNLLLKQFVQGRPRSFLCSYVELFGCKGKGPLDAVVPDAFDKLAESTEAFLEGLAGLDEHLVAKVATAKLQGIIVPEIKKLKASHTKIRKVRSQRFRKRYEQLQREDIRAAQEFARDSQMKGMRVSPYVVFGRTMAERLKDAEPWHNLHRLGSNRFIDLQGGLLKLTRGHVYGFHCFYEDKSINFQISEGSKVHRSQVQQFQVSFEADADSLEFFVADFNNLVQKQ